MRPLLLAACFALLIAGSGCVRRTILITSDPEGALVHLNDQEIGRTPVEVDFIYYGEYDVRLELDGYEPIMTGAKANPPLWDNIPIDLIAEAIPGEPHAQVRWHYDLQPPNDDPHGMRSRAMALRGEIELPPETEAGEDEDQAEPRERDGARDEAAEAPPAPAGVPREVDLNTIWNTVFTQFRDVGYEGLSRPRQVFFSVWEFDHQVGTGGFRQYLYNSNADYTFALPGALDAVGAMKTKALAQDAFAVLSDGEPSRDRLERRAIMAEWDEGGAEYARLSELDDAYYQGEEDVRGLLRRYVSANWSAFE